VSASAARDVEFPDGDPHEKRSHRRYPITLEVECKLVSGGDVQSSSSGKTLNISSGGVLIDIGNKIVPGARVELSLLWPFLLDQVCPLKLVMRGRVVRSAGACIAVRADSYEFRTAGFVQRANRAAFP